jgi:hypothetical protein
MAVNVNVKVHLKQIKNSSTRLETYERSVSHWAMNSSLPVIVVETTGADLSSLKACVGAERIKSFEFLSIKARHTHDIGSAEASAVSDALKISQLLKGRTDLSGGRRTQDIVFKITGRYAVHNFENTVTQACLSDSQKRWPSVVLIDPGFQAHDRQETTVIGFNQDYQETLLGWADKGEKCFECHATKLRDALRLIPVHKHDYCILPHLNITRVQEGSTKKWRDHL